MDFSKDYIGIIGALGEEVDTLCKDITNATTQTYAGMEFFKGNLSGKNVVIVKCGVGKINSAVCTQILIDRFDCKLLMNVGVAGGLKNEINVGDIVISTDVVNHDMDAVGFGYKLGEIPRMDNSYFDADKELCALLEQVNKEVNPQIGTHMGRILTGDQFISGKEKKDFLIENFDGSCAEMEGVALAQTAYLNNIPFAVVRAISDKADGSAEMDYSTFKDGAIVHIVSLVEETLKRL